MYLAILDSILAIPESMSSHPPTWPLSRMLSSGMVELAKEFWKLKSVQLEGSQILEDCMICIRVKHGKSYIGIAQNLFYPPFCSHCSL